MSDSNLQCRITRVVDGDHEVQLAQLQAVMQRIQTSLCNFPPAERMYLSKALLNLAVTRILSEAGSPTRMRLECLSLSPSRA